MANSTIANLTAASALSGPEFFYTVQGNADRNATANQIAAFTLSRISTFPGYASGNYYLTAPTGSAMTSTSGSSSGALYLYPFEVRASIGVTALAGRVNTVSSGGNFALAIYANNPSTNRPTGSPLASVTGISTATAGMVSGTTASTVTLAPGWYWAASQADNATVRFGTFSTVFASAIIGSATLANVMGQTGAAFIQYSASATYGTFPDLTSATITESTQGVPLYAVLVMRAA